MASIRRRQQQQQGIQFRDNSTFAEPISPPDFDGDANSSSSSSSLAAKAIRASSAAHKDSSLSSAYTSLHSASPPASRLSNPTAASLRNSQETEFRDYTSRKSKDESKHGFWGSLARKAKAFLDDDEGNEPQQLKSDETSKQTISGTGAGTGRAAAVAADRHHDAYPAPENGRSKAENPALRKGLGAISSSLNYIGNAVEEGFTVVENRTAGIIQETRKHIRKKPTSSQAQNQAAKPQMQNQVPMQMQADQEIQLKASRDVAMAMAAKAKLLLRELKTVKADLAFAKERCGQLEEENRILRENRERGDNPEDDDLIRLQLESLLGEKARLAHENSVYARENRFLREVVEYHQLTMQDVVYLDEKTEQVTEVYPIPIPPFINSEEAISSSIHPVPVPPPEFAQPSYSQPQTTITGAPIPSNRSWN